MALRTNFTEDENQKKVVELYCSAELFRGLDGELIFLSVLNVFLSIAAFLGNTLILVALHKETSPHPPSKLLYLSLAITDLCVGIITEPGFVCDLLNFCCEPKMGYLPLHESGTIFLRCYFVLCVFIDTDRYKRGQTSRLVARAQIQTSCNFETNTHSCNWFLDFVHCRSIYNPLEYSYNIMVSTHLCSSVSSHHNLRLTKNFSLSASKSNSCSELCCSTSTEPSNSIEHSSIQKGSVQCTVGAGNSGYLLSSI